MRLLPRRGWPRHLRAVSRTDGMIGPAEADYLYRCARDAAGGVIVEVGSYRGRSTVALALGTRAGRRLPVYAVDPHEPFTGALGGHFGPEDRAAFFRTMLATGCYADVRLLNIDSSVLAQGWSAPVALLWLDGDHSYPGVLRDYDAWRPHLLPAATVLFDDATDPALGPHRLIEEMVASGEAVPVATVGRVRGVRLGQRRGG